ncbi:cutinase family protein [Hoyosella sp. YIM 151337]|uniref:cutinase family protein n=1 Tax=Hoyosella sp. YIM 151337 TaxID=2992742 RepID=UPI002236467D|nr:cutinase family protein [Hoyosella sp. YIM 151337]MCW4352099.1 cutinase family protein [Hoyosella sp. YIM 151337]
MSHPSRHSAHRHHPLFRQRMHKALTAGMMMALVAVPTAAANPPSDPDAIPEHATVVERSAHPLGTDCEPLYVLATRGSNEPPQDRAVIYEDPVYPADTETRGMGPLLNDFYDTFVREQQNRGAAEPAGFGVVYPAVRVGDGWFRYPANYRESIEEGAQRLRETLQEINALCAGKHTDVVVTGISQGADVINRALSDEVAAGADDFRNVSAVALFGDPSRSSSQPSVKVGATHGDGFFRMFPIGDGAQDEWMRERPGSVISFCIPGDNVCDPLEHPQDSDNAAGIVGVSPFARHESYHTENITLECLTSSVSAGTWLSAKECAVKMVADKIGHGDQGSTLPETMLARSADS